MSLHDSLGLGLFLGIIGWIFNIPLPITIIVLLFVILFPTIKEIFEYTNDKG